jgi:cell division protease FtsH
MNFKNIKNNPRILFGSILLFVIGFIMLVQLTEYSRTAHTISYTTFLNYVENGFVKSVRINGQEADGVLRDGKHFETVIADTDKNWDILRQHGVEITVAPLSGQFTLWHLILLLSFLSVPAMVWYAIRQSRNAGGGGGSNIFTMGKSKAKMFLPSQIKVNFSSVAGMPEAKEELFDVVDFLKNPEKYQRLGAKLTRGVLLVGEPGNGKTLLAKAVAGEANCPFFSISGSDFIEVFVGVGAARVRDLFAQARKHAPAIIFIDEIDAVGRQRGSGLGGGHDEREQTLNQLLTEMDGFESTTSIVVMAATNRPDVLDKALLRPGRFDRRVTVTFPDLISREQILRVHAKDVKMDPAIDLQKVARATPGFSGADLANLINESAIIASKNNQAFVTMHDIENARDKMMLGKEMKSRVMSPEERANTAYHEAGHALVRLLLPEETEPLHKVTIVPRGSALGVTHWLPEREKFITSREEMLASIKSALGGRIAEEIIFNKLSTGASDDFKRATEIAYNMVCVYGMSPKLGPAVFQQQVVGEKWFSEHTSEIIDKEIRAILDECYAQTKTLLEQNRDKLEILAKELLDKETLYAGDIYPLLGITSREEHRLT